MSAIQLDALIQLFNQVQDIESKLKQLQALNENQLVDVTIAACLANCKVVEALKNHVKWSTESVKLN